MHAAGYDAVSVQFFSGTGGNAVNVSWRTDATDAAGARAEAREVAGIVWRTAKFRIDRVSLTAFGTVNGTEERTRSELERDFGPRDPALDAHGLFPSWLLPALLLGAIAVTVGIVVLVRRTKRRNSRPPSWPPGGYGPLGGYGPPGAAGPSAADPWASPPG